MMGGSFRSLAKTWAVSAAGTSLLSFPTLPKPQPRHLLNEMTSAVDTDESHRHGANSCKDPAFSTIATAQMRDAPAWEMA